MPALGLSNKAVFDSDLSRQKDNLASGDSANMKRDAYPEVYFSPQNLTRMFYFKINALRTLILSCLNLLKILEALLIQQSLV